MIFYDLEVTHILPPNLQNNCRCFRVPAGRDKNVALIYAPSVQKTQTTLMVSYYEGYFIIDEDDPFQGDLLMY